MGSFNLCELAWAVGLSMQGSYCVLNSSEIHDLTAYCWRLYNARLVAIPR